MKKLRTFTILSVAILLSMCASRVFAASIQSGADHLLTIQNADGSFTWPHGPSTPGPGHTNITGAYGVTGDTDHRTGATAAADFLLTKTSDWVGTSNPSFLLKTYDVTGNTAYKDKATEFFNELATGTYTRSGTDYNTAS